MKDEVEGAEQLPGMSPGHMGVDGGGGGVRGGVGGSWGAETTSKTP